MHRYTGTDSGTGTVFTVAPPATRSFKPVTARISVTSLTQPMIVQLQGYEANTEKVVVTTPGKIIPTGTTRTLRLRWPRVQDWWEDTNAATKYLYLRVLDPDGSTTATGTVYYDLSTRVMYGNQQIN